MSPRRAACPRQNHSSFATAFASIVSDKTLNTWLAGLHFWHIVDNTTGHGEDMLCHVRRGFAKMVPASSRRPKRPPVTTEALCTLADHLDFTSPFDCAVAVVVFVVFWCCCRLGGLVIPSLHTFDPLKHVSRSILSLSIGMLANGAQFASFHIPWSKTTREQGADISITQRFHRTCPLTAMARHAFINARVPGDAPLFAYLTHAGWSALIKPDFMTCCNAIWVAQGYPDMPKHAFHIGGTSEFLLEGVSPDIRAPS